MKDEILIEQLKQVLNVISFFQIREQTLRKELEFYINKQDYICEIDFCALKRLEHEIMFLSVDAYSLHQGISKQKSFLKNTVQNYGRQFTKVDKRDTFNDDNVIFLGVVDSDDEPPRSPTEEEKNDFIRESNKEAIQSRKKLKEKVGIKSHEHKDIGKWNNENFDENNDNDIKNLSKYRKEFAHRLDSFDKLLNELKVYQPQELLKILNVVQTVLKKYQDNLHDILLYMTSIDFMGIKKFQYNSMVKYLIKRNELYS